MDNLRIPKRLDCPFIFPVITVRTRTAPRHAGGAWPNPWQDRRRDEGPGGEEKRPRKFKAREVRLCLILEEQASSPHLTQLKIGNKSSRGALDRGGCSRCAPGYRSMSPAGLWSFPVVLGHRMPAWKPADRRMILLGSRAGYRSVERVRLGEAALYRV